MHYACQSYETLRAYFANITERLIPGGMFIGTIPDADFLVSKLRALPEDEYEFGNQLYGVKFL